MNILITGSNGLIGNSASQFFLQKGGCIFGIDNNMRQKFFGLGGSTLDQRKILKQENKYQHFAIDIRNTKKMEEMFKRNKFDLIVHTAAQPSHNKAMEVPFLDFDINARGTLNLLELTRKYQKQTVFVFTSTNKVYGDAPNKIFLRENKTCYLYKDKRIGIDERMSVDQNTHSLFGASKLSADIYVQEYGRYFGLKTTVLRLGCVTGSSQSSVKLHGFLSFLIKSLINDNKYEIIGYKGKQVRDQIDAFDTASAIYEIYKKPNKGEVFNLGGGLSNSASILEIINIVSTKLRIKPKIKYKLKARIGDHICYITDNSKFKKFYPNWRITKSLNMIIDEIITHEKSQKH